jgi:hypothetical protein
MNILDRLMPGIIVRDFGTLRNLSFKIGGESTNVLLLDRYGEFQLVLRKKMWALLGFGVNDVDFSLESAYKLRTIIDECEQIANTEDSSPSSRKSLRRRIIRDFGRLEQVSSLLYRETKRVRFIEVLGKLWLELRYSAVGFLGAGWNSKSLTLEEALKLREFINASEELTQELLPTPYNPRPVILRNMSLITIIGGIFLFSAPYPIVAVFLGLVMMMFYISRYLFFWRFKETRRYLNIVTAIVVSFTLVAIATKFIL